MKNLAILFCLYSLIMPIALFGTLPDAPPQHPCSTLKQDLLKRIFSLETQDDRKHDSDWDVVHYVLDLTVDINNSTISGKVLIQFISSIDKLNQIYVDLWNNMSVDSVSHYGKPLNFVHEQNMIKIDIPYQLNEGDSYQVLISYHGQPTNAGFQAFSFDYHGTGEPIISSLSEPTYARTWWACKDTPADKATADIFLTVPSELTAVSNGTLQEVTDNQNGTSTFHWHESYPIATYLVSIAISDYVEITDTYISPLDSSEMPLVYFVYPEHQAEGESKFSITKEIISAFAEHFCEYPFINEKYGLAEFPWNGGMEHQTITSMGSNIIGYYQMDSINAHELAHQWWGDMITPSHWADIWLNEGFATYSEALWQEFEYGSSAYHAKMNSMADIYSFNGPIYNPSELFGITVYHKGAWVLHMLRKIVGDSTFFKILNTYAQSEPLKYGNATTEDFQYICEVESGASLDWFFKEWIYGIDNPYYFTTWDTIPMGSGFITSLQLKQKQSSVPSFQTPLDVKLSDNLNNSDFLIMNLLPTQTYAFYTSFKPYFHYLDPDNWILDQQNDSSRELVFTALFPCVRISTDFFTGIAFANLSSKRSTVKLTLLDNNGNLLNTHSFPANTTITLAPHSQEAYLLGQLFDTGDSLVEATLMVESDSSYIESYFMSGQKDLTSLDGSFVDCYPSGTYLFVPSIKQDTIININNPSDHEGSVHFRCYSSDGVLLDDKLYPIISMQSFSLNPFQAKSNSSDFKTAYSIIESEVPIVCQSQTFTDGHLQENPAIPIYNFAQTLYAPHFAVGNSWDTLLNLINPANQETEVNLRFFSQDGAPISLVNKLDNYTFSIGPKEQLTLGISSIMLNTNVLSTGSIEIHSTNNFHIGGTVEFVFKDKSQLATTALPLLSSGTMATIFPHNAMGLGYFTGISILNPSSDEQMATIFLYDKNGNNVGTQEISIPAKGKYINMMRNIFPSRKGQIGGYLFVESSFPLIYYEIFGNDALDFISSIPARNKDGLGSYFLPGARAENYR